MTYAITGLDPAQFQPLFGLSEAEFAKRGVIRKNVTEKPGFPCRITLEDPEVGETVLLMNYESHTADTPYRSAYAIYVREAATAPARLTDELPQVFANRPIALRIFNADGMLVGATLARGADIDAAIRGAFESPQASYIHAHNAAHGCFSARIDRT